MGGRFYGGNMNALKIAKEQLSRGYTLVCVTEGKVYTSTLRGVRPLIDFLDTGTDISGAYVADKVVGCGAAWLYVKLGVRALYAAVVSGAALSVLHGAGICVEYGELVDRILNRAGDGFCPIESAVIGIESPDEAISAIRQRLLELK